MADRYILLVFFFSNTRIRCHTLEVIKNFVTCSEMSQEFGGFFRLKHGPKTAYFREGCTTTFKHEHRHLQNDK